jgi:hypothetical protein
MLNASFAALGDSRPDHHVRDEVCIGGFVTTTDRRKPNGSPFAADCRVDTDSRRTFNAPGVGR